MHVDAQGLFCKRRGDHHLIMHLLRQGVFARGLFITGSCRAPARTTSK